MRPACDIEVVECLELAIQDRTTPTSMILSRQKVDNVRTIQNFENLCRKGMYEIAGFENNGKPQISIIASGSEVSLALKTKNELFEFDIRIISAPCLDLFDQQPEEYKKDILNGRKLFIEAGSSDIWYKYRTQENDIVWGISDFGESGTSSELFNKFGFTVQNIRSLLTK